MGTVCDNNINYKYIYRLTKTDFDNRDVYGIEIERDDYKGSKNTNIERESVDIISTQKNKVRKLLNKLFENKVSPIQLIDVIGYYVDECIYSDFFSDHSLN